MSAVTLALPLSSSPSEPTETAATLGSSAKNRPGSSASWSRRTTSRSAWKLWAIAADIVTSSVAVGSDGKYCHGIASPATLIIVAPASGV